MVFFVMEDIYITLSVSMSGKLWDLYVGDYESLLKMGLSNFLNSIYHVVGNEVTEEGERRLFVVIGYI
jgi:hypothetical protein